MNKNLVNIDCTLRDGGYYNNWDFSDDFVKKYLLALSSAKINYIELGFRLFNNKGFKGAYAYCSDEFINRLDIPNDINIALMINIDDLLLESQFNSEMIEKIVPLNSDKSKVKLFRIACRIDDFKVIAPAFNLLKKKGYQTAVNIMQISEMNENQLNIIGKLATEFDIDILYLADSLGSLIPDDIFHIVRNLRVTWKGSIGFHAHDNKGLALINTFKAIENGISWIDSTVNGMGRGAGNTKTEELLLSLDNNKKDKSYLIPLLKMINDDFKKLKERYCWGTNPYYFLAAEFSIHPTYIQTILSDDRFKEEDILSVIDYLKGEDSTKFISDQLESAKNFYTGNSIGTFSACSIINNKEVLIVGSSPNLDSYKVALEDFIRKNQPIVLALNTCRQIDDNLIDFRIACNPIRLMADFDTYLRLPQPLITPLSMLPDSLSRKLIGKKILDYGIGISNEGFEFHEKYGIIPNQLVFAYALSFVASGNAKKVFLSGFEGYGLGDIRNTEINELLDKFRKKAPYLRLIAITPSQYSGLEAMSVYGM
tara:strand:- start:4943 stop:6559 length:1617 start_codon:yes stop_codon:yes gene_type:complete